MCFNEKEISSIDANNMKNQINSLYSQISDSIEIMNKFVVRNNSYSNRARDYNKILIIGMGGSAIGADFARTIIEDESCVPIFVLRDYFVPNWVDKKTFVIASSYSGNTEETLTAYNKCLEIGCKSIVISTGGELSKQALVNNVGTITLPKGFQPRAAIGYSLSILLLLFIDMGLINKKTLDDIVDTSKNKLGSKYINYSKTVAEKIFNTFPVIYSSGGYMEILSVRLKGQLAENSKILSYYNTFPEHNHNEIEGWNKLENLTSKFSILWIKDENDSSAIKKRMDIVGKIISDFPANQIELNLDGDSKIERVFSMIHYIDWISFHLAIMYKVNPSPVDNIMKLKSLMGKK